MKYVCLLILSLIFYCQTKLTKIISIFRHTHRFPNKDYFDSYIYIPGELTMVGMKAAFKKGEEFGELYKEFLEKLNPDNVKIYSSTKIRCIKTLLYRYHGIISKIENKSLFNLKSHVEKDFIKNNRIKTYDEEKDYMFSFLSKPQCFEKFKHISRRNNKFQSISQKLMKLFENKADYFKKFYDTGKIKSKFPFDIYEIDDFLEKSIENKFDYVTHEDIELKKLLDNSQYEIKSSLYHEEEIYWFYSSKIFHKILRFIEDDDSKLVFFSSHDFNVITFLKCLGLLDILKIDYNTEVTFEVHETENEKFLKIKMNNEYLRLEVNQGREEWKINDFKEYVDLKLVKKEAITQFCEQSSDQNKQDL